MPLMVEKIENGTVIDRIDAYEGIKVLEKLRLIPREGAEGVRPRMALLINVPSRHMGHKDILKIEGRELGIAEVNKIALMCPHARLNVIQAGRVARKTDVKLPAELLGVAGCPNPQCVTGAQNLAGHFYVEKERLRCKYCERLFRPDELVL
jgi:aspartate carbamoyltransferase regulatory subunit